MTTQGVAMPSVLFGHGADAVLASSKRPPGSGDSPADRFGDEGAKRQAWLREMERAQISGWFLPNGREALQNEVGVKSSWLLERSNSLGGFAPARGVPYSAEGSHVGRGEAIDVNNSPLDPMSESHQRSWMPERGGAGVSSEAALSHGGDDVRAQIEKGSNTPPVGFRSAIAHFASASVLQTSEQASLSTSASSVRESTSLVPRSDHPAMDLPRVFSSHVSPAIERVGSIKFAASQPMQGVRQAGYDEGDVHMPNLGAPRNPATRLHTQWNAEGLSLWIGMDGTARQVELQAQTIVATLQRTLKSQGQRLSRVVCNGTVVFDEKLSELGRHRLTDFSSFLNQDERFQMSADICIPQSSKETR